MPFGFSLIEALSRSHEKILGRDTTIDVLRHIMPTLICAIILPRNAPPKPKPTWPRPQRFSYWNPDPEPLPVKDSTGDNMIMLHEYLLELGLKKEAGSLLQRVAQEGTNIALLYFDEMLFPYLQQVVKSCVKHNISIEIFEQPIRGLLQTWRHRVSGPQPAHPTNWSQVPPPNLCGCEVCNTLGRFISDPNSMSTSFTMATKQRQHIEAMLGNTGRPLPQGATGHDAKTSDYDTRTEKGHTPFTLVVTKTKRQWHRAVQEWQTRTAAVESKIGQLGLPRCFLHNDSNGRSADQAPLPDGHTQGDVASSKRKRDEQDENLPPSKRSGIEVIDLLGTSP